MIIVQVFCAIMSNKLFRVRVRVRACEIMKGVFMFIESISMLFKLTPLPLLYGSLDFALKGIP